MLLLGVMVDIAIKAILTGEVTLSTYAYAALLVSAAVFARFLAAYSVALDASVERLLTHPAEEFTLAFFMPLRLCLHQKAAEVLGVCLLFTAALRAILLLGVMVDKAIKAILDVVILQTIAYAALPVSANVFARFLAAVSLAVDASVERLLTRLAVEFTLAVFMPLRLCPRQNATGEGFVCLIFTAALRAIPVLNEYLCCCCCFCFCFSCCCHC